MPTGSVFLVGVLLGLAALAPAVALRRYYRKKIRELLNHEAAAPPPLPEPEAPASVLRPADPFPMLERLAGSVAEQFDDLLTTINGYGELVLYSLNSRDPARRDVEEICRAGERAARIVDELLAFSGRQPVLPVPIDLNAMIRQMHPELQQIAGSRIAVTTTLDLNLCPLEADWHWLERIVRALTMHARSAMPEGGALGIETANMTEGDSSYVMLAVHNTGPCLDEEARAHAFDPEFERGGLGLAMVRGVVRKSGGFVRIENGKGTTIRIFLPRLEQADDRTAGRGLYVVRGASAH